MNDDDQVARSVRRRGSIAALGGQVAIGCLVVALIAGHAFWDWLVIDSTTLGLVGILVLLSVLHRMRMLEGGGIRIELSEDEAYARTEAALSQTTLVAKEKGISLDSGVDHRVELKGFSNPQASTASCKHALEKAIVSFGQSVHAKIDDQASLSENVKALFAQDKLDVGIKRAVETVSPVLDACARGDVSRGDWDLAHRLQETVDALSAVLASQAAEEKQQ